MQFLVEQGWVFFNFGGQWSSKTSQLDGAKKKILSMSCLLAKTIVAKWEKKKRGSLPQKKNTNSML
jgi:hypothetical protein